MRTPAEIQKARDIIMAAISQSQNEVTAGIFSISASTLGWALGEDTALSALLEGLQKVAQSERQ